MSFVGEAIAAVGTALASVFSSAGAAAAGETAAVGAEAVSSAAGGAAAAGASSAAASSSVFDLGSGFWAALGTGFTILSTINNISSNNQMANQSLVDTGMQMEANQLDYARRLSDIRRETDKETARRTSLLSATGGLADGADMVLEGLLEGARAESRLATDLGFEMGALTTRASNIRAGNRRSNIGAVLEGGYRLSSLLTDYTRTGRTR
jgi:hypothetical protein